MLKLCWVCDGCPAKGLRCSEKEEEERKAARERQEERHEKEEKEREELKRAWRVNDLALPCDHPAKEGYLWSFNHSEDAQEWQHLGLRSPLLECAEAIADPTWGA